MRILFLLPSKPLSGGAPTIAYECAAEVQKLHPETYIAVGSDPSNRSHNPLHLKNTYYLKGLHEKGDPFRRFVYALHKVFTKIKPDIIIGKSSIWGSFIPLMHKYKFIYWASSSEQTHYFIEKKIINTAQEMFEKDGYRNKNLPEDRTIWLADAVLPISSLDKRLFEHIYPEYKFKMLKPFDGMGYIYPFEEYPFKKRTVDVLFASTDWNRYVRNKKLMKRVALECDKLGLVTRIMEGAPRADVIDMLCNTKCVCIPSRYESLSLFGIEALFCNCGVVISSNIGIDSMYTSAHIPNKLYNNVNVWVTWIKSKLKDYITHTTNVYYPILQSDRENRAKEFLEMIQNV